MHPIYTLLCENGFNQNFKIFSHLFGVNAGILLSHFISKMNYYHSKDLLVDGEWFYRRRDDIEENTSLTHTQQRNALSILKKTQIIETCKKDNPAKMYYKINTQILFFILQEAIELKKCIENKTPDKLTEIGRKALQEYSGNETLDQDLMFPYYKILCFLTSIIIYYIKENYIQIKKDFSFQNNKNSLPINIPDPKPTKKSNPVKKINGRIPFRETFQMFPPEFQENKEFKTAYRAWWSKRNDEGLKPLTKGQIKTSASIFKKHFTVEEAIARLEDAESKSWFTCVFKDDRSLIKGQHYIRKNGNGGNGKVKPSQVNQPKPLPQTEKILEFLREESLSGEAFDTAFLNKQVTACKDYCRQLWSKWEAEEKANIKEAIERQDQYTIDRYDRINSNLPNENIIFERYILSLRKWVKDRNEQLFKWDHKLFIKFRKQLQKDYYEMEWETGNRI